MDPVYPEQMERALTVAWQADLHFCCCQTWLPVLVGIVNGTIFKELMQWNVVNKYCVAWANKNIKRVACICLIGPQTEA